MMKFCSLCGSLVQELLPQGYCKVCRELVETSVVVDQIMEDIERGQDETVL